MTCAFTIYNDPMPNDSRWDLWYKLLCRYQGYAGADPANNPSARMADSYYDLRRKVLNAVNNANGI